MQTDHGKVHTLLLKLHSQSPCFVLGALFFKQYNRRQTHRETTNNQTSKRKDSVMRMLNWLLWEQQLKSSYWSHFWFLVVHRRPPLHCVYQELLCWQKSAPFVETADEGSPVFKKEQKMNNDFVKSCLDFCFALELFFCIHVHNTEPGSQGTSTVQRVGW